MVERTAAQAGASRANGALSQGPVTEDGKANSASNSRKHGLCSKEFVLEGRAEQARFDGLLKELEFAHQARNALEREACHHLAVAMWRRRVCDNLEKELLQAVAAGRVCAVAGGDGLPGLNAINRYRARIARDLKEARAELIQLKAERAQAFTTELERSKELSQRKLLKEVVAELGPEAFDDFKETVTNEPKPNTEPAHSSHKTSNLNRQNRRRAEKIARKTTKRPRR